MAGRLEVFKDLKPLQLGLDVWHRKPRSMRRRDQFQEFRHSPRDNQARAKEFLDVLIKDHPEIVVSRDELERFKVEDPAALYEHPTETLMYFSPHMIGHIYTDLAVWTPMAKYANSKYKNDPTWTPINVEAGQYGAITHDGFRTENDRWDTLARYHKHGKDAATNLEISLERMQKPMPKDPKVVGLVKEIDEFHDVDHRPVDQKSKDLELFTVVDKLELSRLMRPELGSYRRFRRLQEALYLGVKEVTALRMRVYEGKDPRIMALMKEFLPVADAMYTLRSQHMQNQLRDNGGVWSKVDQFEAVMWAGEQLGLIKPDDAAEQASFSEPMKEQATV